ncbi:hypothetical protein GCM10012286_62380 [Streptomyces lasiicapitis]|uniref:Uncharacterized protein n=1 Tax=Streptomyces lasiicapitis TaxID=1923961 RepID=A0ABQ2MM52_9ACTN|nr:hypothetical protein GCM10012286_62380 [Streptomyces lasiicapitis]
MTDHRHDTLARIEEHPCEIGEFKDQARIPLSQPPPKTVDILVPAIATQAPATAMARQAHAGTWK